MAARVIGFSAAVGLLGACAASTVDDEPAPSPPATSTTTSGGGASSSGGGGAGGDDPGPCAQDCSIIDTGNPCLVAVCNEGQQAGPIGECVVVENDGASCDDGAFCTTDDSCMAGACVGGPPNDCGMGAAECQVVTCDEDDDVCELQPGPNGEPCNGGDLCLSGAMCTNGMCVGGQLEDCFLEPVPAPEACYNSVCNPQNGLCEPVASNDGAACDDGTDLCQVDGVCSAGSCVNTSPKDCSSLTVGCEEGVCEANTGTCVAMTVPNGGLCNDLDACTTGETCTAGVCGMGSPVTTCSLTADGCCPGGCTEVNDADCVFTCDLYAISSSRQIYTVDESTGALTPGAMAGSIAATTGGLAQDPTSGVVYLTSTSNDSLYTLDLLTGATTLVGPYGDTAIVMHGLEFNPDTGTLYGHSFHDGGLYTISTTTGTATLVGTTGVPGFGNLGYDSLNGVMYMTSGGTDSLYTINLANAAVTPVGTLNGPTNPQALAYDAETDTLYLADPGTDTLYTVNRQTGAATAVGSFGSPNLLGLICYEE